MKLGAQWHTHVSRLAVLCAAVLTLLFVIVIPPAALAAASGGPVVLVTIDTLRADHVGIYGYRHGSTPTLDVLGRSSVVFERAYAQVPMTVPSHASLLTGTYPPANGVRDFSGSKLPQSLPTLAELFRRAGYRTAGFVSAYVVSAVWGFDRGFQIFDERLPHRRFADGSTGLLKRRAAATVDAALPWLAIQPDSHFFLWLHLYDPHSPYDPPSPFQQRFAARPYDGEIAYVDQQLGRLLAALRQRHWFDDATVLVTSDHGEGLGEHGEAEHGLLLYDATLHVPLIVKCAAHVACEPRRVGTPVELTDVAPTLTALMGLGSIPGFQGRSLAPLLMGKSSSPARGLYAETLYPATSLGWHAEMSWRFDHWKLIDSGRLRLFDVARDPSEQNNLADQERALAEELRSQLQAFLAHFHTPALTPVSGAALEALTSLGYVAGSTGGAAESANLPDPVPMVAAYNELVAATEESRSDPRSAAQRYEALLARHPEMVGAWFAAAENALAAKMPAKAEDDCDRAIKLRRDFVAAWLLLVRAAAAAKDYQRADQALESARQLAPLDPKVYYAAAEVALLRHDSAEAERSFQQSIALGDFFGAAHRELGRLLLSQKRYREGADALQQALDSDPNDAIAWNALGIAFAHLSRPADAIAAYRRAVVLAPTYAVAHLNLAYAYQSAGNSQAALSEKARVCRLDSALCAKFVAGRAGTTP